MNVKKNSKLDLESKRGLFFQLGLLVTGTLTLAAFTYSDPLTRADETNLFPREAIGITYLSEVAEPKEDPQQSHLEKEELPMTSTVISTDLSDNMKSKDNTSASATTTVTGDSGNLPIGPKIIIGNGKRIHVDLGKVETIVDVEASFIGGHEKLVEFMGKNLSYPQISREYGEEGVVYVSFVVEKEGHITDVKVFRGVSPSLDQEAIRVVKRFPNWKPGQINYSNVRTRVHIPVRFTLE